MSNAAIATMIAMKIAPIHGTLRRGQGRPRSTSIA